MIDVAIKQECTTINALGRQIPAGGNATGETWREAADHASAAGLNT